MSQHPNIVKMVDLFENVDHYFIVVEYMDGKDMFDCLRYRQFRISENRAREIMLQIIDAVKYLHSYGIIHRDIENIMMSDNSDKATPNLVNLVQILLHVLGTVGAAITNSLNVEMNRKGMFKW
jgi:serine/threonine protein kinase